VTMVNHFESLENEKTSVFQIGEYPLCTLIPGILVCVAARLRS
jgi:hypothetical protein